MQNILDKFKDYCLIFIFFLLAISVIILIGSDGKADMITPVRQNIIDAVFASGYTINSDEYIVATKSEGFIIKSYVKEGDEVTVGDPLFQLSSDVQSSQLENALAQYNDAKHKASPDSPQIISLQTQIAQAKSQVALDEKNFERYGVLVKTNAVSKLEFEKSKLQYDASVRELQVLEKSLEDLMSALQLNLVNAENQLKIQKEYLGDYYIMSTKKGLVLDIFKEQGELALKGTSLAKIGSGKTIAKLLIAEEDINDVRVGQQTKIALNTVKEKPIDAVVFKIYPAFDVGEQSFILEANFVKEENTILANTQLQANIIISQKENALVIPVEYLGENKTVILSDNSEVLVETGVRSDKWVEIVSGITETDKLKKTD